MQRLLSFFLIILFVLFIFLPANAEEEEERGRAYYDFGVFAYEDGDYEDAEKNLKKALEFDPDNPFYNHFLGKTYLKMERYKEAENYLKTAWKMNPDISGLKYDLAFLNYKISNYSRAADLFGEIVKEDPSNVLAHYHAGISLYKLKRYGKAVDYFISAAQKSPTIKANGFYYAGICYLKMEDIEKAVEKFEYVRDSADSELLRENALKWLQAIEERKKALKPYSIYLKVAHQYDSNVRLEPLDQDIYADDSDYLTACYLSGRYNFTNRKDFTIGAGYNHYQTWYNRLDEYNLTGSIFNLYTKYRLYQFNFTLGYIPSYYWLDSESYLMRHQLKPEVMWEVNEKLDARFSYSYYRNNYFQDDKRDGHTNEVFLDICRKIGNSGGHRLFAGIGYEDNSASHPDQYYGQLKTKLGISVKIPWDILLSLTGKYYDKEYDNIDSSFNVKREDDKYVGSISLSGKFFYEWLNISVEFDYTKNDSNISDYSYQRKVTSLSLTAKL